MRPIDADKLSKQIEELYLDGDSASNHLCINNEDTLIGKFQVLDLICDQPTVDEEDVVPMIHARWENGQCTNCHTDKPVVVASIVQGYMHQYSGRLNYCPNCGAKMDE